MSLVPTLLWGALPIVLKLITQTLKPETITWYRFWSALLFFGVILARQKQLPFRKAQLRTSWLPLVIAIGGLCSNFVIFLYALHYVTPGASQVLIQLGPILTLLGSVLIFKEPFQVRQWVGFGVFVTGLILFFHHRISELVQTWSDYYVGILLIVLAAILWAGYALAQKRLLNEGWTPNQILFWIYLVGTVGLFPWSSPMTIRNLSITGWLLLGFATINGILAYVGFATAQVYWESSKISAVLTLTPLEILTYFFLI